MKSTELQGHSSLVLPSVIPATFEILHEFPTVGQELAWREFLGRVALPSHYTSPEYFREPYFTLRRPFAILAIAGANVIGVLTGIHEGDKVSCGLPTRPQVQVDPDVDLAVAMDALILGLEEEARYAKVISIYCWEWAPLSPTIERGYRLRVLQGSCIVCLDREPTVLHDSFNKRRRAGIRKALRSGVDVIQASTPEDFDDFYRIASVWYAIKGLECYSYETEKFVFDTTKSNRVIFLARYKGKIIASNVLRFFPGGLIEASRNSSLLEFQHLKPNDLMLWKAIEWACGNNFQKMSLGASHRFLREFGSPPTPILRYRKDRTFLRRHDLREAVVDVARNCFQKLPARWAPVLRRLLGKEIQAGW